jgi:hypothetical protein
MASYGRVPVTEVTTGCQVDLWVTLSAELRPGWCPIKDVGEEEE